ncbi:MAG: hypothetical protein WC838_06740 [Candidatus Margulisiibacteriota bacterium]|jgi:hypothetical protein
MKIQIMILVLILSGALALAGTDLRGGIRGGGLSLGIDSASNQPRNWALGYGASLQSNDKPVGVFLSFSNPLRTQGAPAYVSIGPVAYFGNSSSAIGAFLDLGWVGIFEVSNLRLETGIEVRNDRSGINIELLYQL